MIFFPSSCTVAFAQFYEGKFVRYSEGDKLIANTPFLFPVPFIYPGVILILSNIIVVLFNKFGKSNIFYHTIT